MRRAALLARASLAALAMALCGLALPEGQQQHAGGDPYGSMQWPGLRDAHLGRGARVVFDAAHVRVLAPAFAEDAMNVPVSVAVEGLGGVRRIVVLVDRNPIREVLEFEPLQPSVKPSLNFRFKLEQASPVRAAVQLADGSWHVGGTWVDAAGGGCTAPGETRRDGSWARLLGEVGARRFVEPDGSGSRLRLRVMHPMDTGLVGGIPAFHLSRLSLRDAAGAELLRMTLHEPVSENPVFSFDFDAGLAPGPLRLSGMDNNGNRIARTVE